MKHRCLTAFGLGLAAALATGWLAFPRVLYQRQEQPLQFSHKTHTGDKVGSKCEDCHAFAVDGRFGGVPKLETCAGCHAAPVTENADEKRLVAEYVTPRREIPWKVYARQPMNVWFSHATHVRVAKLECERCHGGHGKTEKLRPYEENRISGYSRDIWGASIARITWPPPPRPSMKMDDCMACHRDRGVAGGCLACHQ